MTLADMQFEGGTDVRFLFGFGSSLGRTCLPEAQPDVQRSLLHYLDGGTEGHFSSIGQDEVTPILNPPWGMILQNDLMRREGLLCATIKMLVICPSYFLKG